MCHRQEGNGCYKTSVSQEKRDTQNGDHASFNHPISLKVRLSLALFSCFSILFTMDFFFCNYKLICTQLCLIPVFDVTSLQFLKKFCSVVVTLFWLKWFFLVLVQTDKTGRVIVETPSDLQNLMILGKSNREQKSAVRAVVAPPVVHTAVMHNTR